MPTLRDEDNVIVGIIGLRPQDRIQRAPTIRVFDDRTRHAGRAQLRRHHARMDVGARGHDELHATRARELQGSVDTRPIGTRAFAGRAYEFIRPQDDHHRADWDFRRFAGQPTPPGRPDPEVRTDEEKRRQGKKYPHPALEPSRHRNDHYAQNSVGKGTIHRGLLNFKHL